MVATAEDLNRLDGEQVEAAGLYQAIPAPRKGTARAGAPRDHAALILQDGTRLYLEAFGNPRARRPEAELTRFDGHAVIVTGIAHKLMPSTGQAPMAPCISDLRDIREQPV